MEVQQVYDASDVFTFGDFLFLLGLTLLACLVIYTIGKVLKDVFKHIHLKVGDKIEVGVETKGE